MKNNNYEKSNSYSLSYFIDRAGLYLKLSEPDYLNAIVDYKAAIALYPKEFHTYYLLAQCLYQAGKKQEALQAYDAYLNLAPHIKVLEEAAKLCIELELFDQALSYFKRMIAVATEKDYHSAAYGHLEYAKVLRKTQKYSEALQECNTVITLNSTSSLNANAYQLLGEIYKELGENEQAEEHFKKSIEILPNQSWIFKYASWLYEKKHYEKAAISYKNILNQYKVVLKALEQDESLEETYVNTACESAYRLGRIYMHLSQCPKAIKYFNMALQINPQHAESQEYKTQAATVNNFEVLPQKKSKFLNNYNLFKELQENKVQENQDDENLKADIISIDSYKSERESDFEVLSP